MNGEGNNIIEANILILCQDFQLGDYLKNLLEGEGYLTNIYQDINSFYIALERQDFETIILDIKGKEESELCKTIRNNFMLRHIPILLLVNREDTIEKIKGIYSGGDDYIEKPIRAEELLTRIKANLWRAQRDLDTNPLTKLPGNSSIVKELNTRIKNKNIFSIAYIDLDNFKEYNDIYGFEWGDKLIKHTTSILYNAIKELGEKTDFLAHIGGVEFILITSPQCVESICKKIIYDFDTTIAPFYKEEDQKRNHILIKDRTGKLIEIPFVTIVIGIASNRKRKITHSGQIIQIATELKQFAKTFYKSTYILDRRKE
ncbi:MAG: diguanylate cyclase [Candidatus Omnitrophica bacterium]|nr:diguanylate cyclase [Candidatus Omnitrophota bacterium]MCM8826278.1 diguanylate cyclase [Candidatus Omnitrophota bacterium]